MMEYRGSILRPGSNRAGRTRSGGSGWDATEGRPGFRPKI
jgi:hypothetical protein